MLGRDPKQTHEYIDGMLTAYCEAIDFTDTDNPDFPEFDGKSFAQETIDNARFEITLFVGIAGPTLETLEVSAEQAGHDFWLTRNGHGAGFWGRGHGKPGDQLTTVCKQFGERTPYVSDEGFIYLDEC